MSAFVDVSGASRANQPEMWEPIIVTKAEISAEIDRLESGPAPATGRRESLIVHPRASAPGLGLAPGIQVTLSVLLPGERSVPLRHNSTQVGFCIEGGGHAVIRGERVDFERYDVWNHPSYAPYWFENTTSERQVRLTYSNAPLLEKLGVHLVEENPPEQPVATGPSEADDEDGSVNPFGTFPLDGGAELMPYETLINPPARPSEVLHWPWAKVREHLDQLVALGDTYRGRRLYLLYNPATGRTNGTTPSFFATMTIRPPKIVDRPHRHISAAINYYFEGSGHSIVAGKRYDWSAGDLMLSAPGWAIHHHASHDDSVYELTVQDQPFNIAMESLLWQEDLRRPARILGVEAGFATNRADARR
jgi:gentisate 1,2-dioxygenase